MVDIPVELFFGFIGMSVVLLIIGLIREPKIPATVVFAGMFMLTITMVTDNLIFNSFLGGDNMNTVHYEVTTTTGLVDICGGATCADIRGEHVATVDSVLIGDTIDCIDVTMRKSNAPTGNAIIGVFDHAQADSDPLIKQFGLQDVSVLSSTNSQTFTYCLPDGEVYTLQFDDVVGVKFTGGLAGTAVRNQQSGINAFDTTNSITVTQDAITFAWSTVANSDFVAKMYLRGADTEIIHDTFEFTELPKTLFAFFSVILMLLGVLLTRMGMG